MAKSKISLRNLRNSRIRELKNRRRSWPACPRGAAEKRRRREGWGSVKSTTASNPLYPCTFCIIAYNLFFSYSPNLFNFPHPLQLYINLHQHHKSWNHIPRTTPAKQVHHKKPALLVWFALSTSLLTQRPPSRTVDTSSALLASKAGMSVYLHPAHISFCLSFFQLKWEVDERGGAEGEKEWLLDTWW